MPGCSKKEDYMDENSLGMVPVEIMEIRTEYGIIRCKAAKMGDTNINAPPDCEECKRMALELGVPLKDVMRMQVASLAPGQVTKIAFGSLAGS
jgi:uncharacterized protein (DUF111 family)